MQTQEKAVVAAIRQACFSGLSSRTLMPLVVAQLRALVPAACYQFTWSSAEGRITNFWADTFMPRRTAWIIANRTRYETDAGITFRDLVRFGRPTGNLRVWWERGFDQTPTYAAVFKPYGFHWFLDGVVRDGARPYGVLAALRGPTETDFSVRDEELFARVLPYLAHALRVDGTRPTLFVRSGRSAMLVAERSGRLVEWSARAHRLAVYALLDEINTESRVEDGDFDQVRGALGEVVRELVQRIEGAPGDEELPVIVRRNGWGEFAFRGYKLSDEAGRTGRIGILVEQHVPLEAHMLERINELPLTTKQKEIVLLSARGQPNSEIARRLSISPNTLKDYLKEIYSRLDINSHQQLVERLGSSGRAASQAIEGP